MLFANLRKLELSTPLLGNEAKHSEAFSVSISPLAVKFILVEPVQ